MKMNLLILTLLMPLLLSSCQTASTIENAHNANIAPVVILTDMEPDDRIALMLASDTLTERIVMVGTNVRHAGRKRDLAKRVLDQENLMNIPVYQGSGGSASDYPDVTSTSPARQYKDEGKHILSAQALKNYANQPHSSQDATNALFNILTKNDNVEIIALSPLTDISHVLRAHPNLIHKIGKIHIMGGWVNKDNVKYTSYNWTMDINAANHIMALKNVPIYLYSSHVFKTAFKGGSLNHSNAPNVIAALNEAKLSSASVQDFTIAANSWDTHVMSLIPALKQRIAPYAGHQFSPSDPFTVLAASQPKLIRNSYPISVHIETQISPQQSGFTVIVEKKSGSHIFLVDEIDTQAFKLILQNSFKKRIH